VAKIIKSHQHFASGAIEFQGQGVISVFEEERTAVPAFFFAKPHLVADAIFASHKDGVFWRVLLECRLDIAEAKFLIDLF
jgi:hypothetical protein